LVAAGFGLVVGTPCTLARRHTNNGQENISVGPRLVAPVGHAFAGSYGYNGASEEIAAFFITFIE